jgi:hypothetical protein
MEAVPLEILRDPSTRDVLQISMKCVPRMDHLPTIGISDMTY